MTDRTKQELRFLIEEGVKTGDSDLKLQSRGECISVAQLAIEELDKLGKIFDKAFSGLCPTKI